MSSKAGDSFVYIIVELPIQESGFYKIGIATHNKTDEKIKDWPKYANSKLPTTLARRITDLQTGNPRKLFPVAYYKFSSKEDAENAERYLHNRFSASRVNDSEWFKLTESQYGTCKKLLKHELGAIESTVFSRIHKMDT